MTPHPPASFKKPVPIGPGSEEAGNPWLAPWVFGRFNRDSITGLIVGSAFFNVEGSFFGPVLASCAQPVDFGLDLIRVLVGLSELFAFSYAKWDPVTVISFLRWVEDSLDVNVAIGLGEGYWRVLALPSYEVNSKPGLWGAVVLGIENTIIQGVSFFTQLGGERLPEFTSMDNFGIGDVLKNEIVGPQCVYSVNADFGCRAPSFFVEKALLSSEFGKGLAWEARDVEVN